jgi:hypothetical protein
MQCVPVDEAVWKKESNPSPSSKQASVRQISTTHPLNPNSEVGVRFSIGHWCFRGSVPSQGAFHVDIEGTMKVHGGDQDTIDIKATGRLKIK